jgi:hypothetical protein
VSSDEVTLPRKRSSSTGTGRISAEFLSAATSTTVWSSPGCNAAGRSAMASADCASFSGAGSIAVGGDDASASFSFSLGVAAHRPLHDAGRRTSLI